MSTRARSFWGWGFADKFPDEDTRAGLVAFAEGVLGFSGLRPRPLPRLESIELPASRIEANRLASADRIERIHHAYGRSYRDVLRGFRGDFSKAPDLVARPKNEAELEALFEWCARDQVALIPYGGGTSVVSGVEADVSPSYRASVSVDLGAFDRVVEVDRVSRAARIQAGATGPGLEAQLATHGLTLRHYPQSYELSTLGGWIATRAGGHYATVHTHIDDFVESVRMLTPIGAWEGRRLPASGAGPSPDRVALGSEGALGVITEAWMRVQDRPRFRSSATVTFREWKAAVDAVRTLAQSGLAPANCRLLDANEAALHRVVEDRVNVLLLGFESADHAAGSAMERAVEIVRAQGGEIPKGVVTRDDAASTWKSAFLDMPYLQSILVSLGAIADTFETACTWDRFDRFHAAITEAVTDAMQRVAGGGRMSCRFTHVYPDGPAPYYTFICPARDGEELAQWSEIKKAASDAIIAHGGTITHHHAVGRMHRPWYDRERPEPFAVGLRAFKRAVDPAGIMNPGVLIDP
ncbi:MAG: FAD-binding oxidoreductase [Polyangiales bacterium]